MHGESHIVKNERASEGRLNQGGRCRASSRRHPAPVCLHRVRELASLERSCFKGRAGYVGARGVAREPSDDAAGVTAPVGREETGKCCVAVGRGQYRTGGGW